MSKESWSRITRCVTSRGREEGLGNCSISKIVSVSKNLPSDAKQKFFESVMQKKWPNFHAENAVSFRFCLNRNEKSHRDASSYPI